MSDWNRPAAALLDLSPPAKVFLRDVLAGLRAEPKTLPCKYFYDRRGSQLFERICALDEYYLTRTELGIMRHHAGAIAGALGREAVLIELGSGSSTKTRILLDRLEAPAAYVPVDISRAHLLQTAEALRERYPALPVVPVSADFTRPFELPALPGPARRRVVYFPGSTIGNFSESAADALLRQIASLCGTGGGLLIGIDLKKDAAILEAAYDDARGVTAEFNRNILRRINRELGADFDPEAFEHRAVYDRVRGRVEISLVSRCEQSATLGDETFDFAAGEAIGTEYCHKYDRREFAQRARRAGLELTHTWTDEREYFAVLLFAVRQRIEQEP